MYYILLSLRRVIELLHFSLFTFRKFTMQRKYCNREKFDFDILTYLYVLRSPEFIYAISMVKYAYMCACGMHVFVCVLVCVCVCMCLNTITSKRWLRFSSNLVRVLQVTVERTLLILLNVGYIVFFIRVQKRFLYITAYGVKFFKRF